MPTTLPSRGRSFMAVVVWASILVPVVFGYVAYNVILHQQQQIELAKSLRMVETISGAKNRF